MGVIFITNMKNYDEKGDYGVKKEALLEDIKTTNKTYRKESIKLQMMRKLLENKIH